MKSLFGIFLYCILCSSVLLAVSKCPKCNFENEENERYCLNCMAEISPLTEAEKLRLDVINKEREAKTEIYIQEQLKKKKLSGQISEYNKNQKVSIISSGEIVSLENNIVAGAITIFDFYADWCGPCKSLAPKIEAMVGDMQNVYLKKINIVKWNSPVAKKYNINSIPSVWIFDKTGKQVYERLNGIEKIRNAVKTLSES